MAWGRGRASWRRRRGWRDVVVSADSHDLVQERRGTERGAGDDAGPCWGWGHEGRGGRRVNRVSALHRDSSSEARLHLVALALPVPQAGSPGVTSLRPRAEEALAAALTRRPLPGGGLLGGPRIWSRRRGAGGSGSPGHQHVQHLGVVAVCILEVALSPAGRRRRLALRVGQRRGTGIGVVAAEQPAGSASKARRPRQRPL